MELLHHPANLFVAEFLGHLGHLGHLMMNFLASSYKANIVSIDVIELLDKQTVAYGAEDNKKFCAILDSYSLR